MPIILKDGKPVLVPDTSSGSGAKSSGTKKRRITSERKLDLSTAEGLERFAIQKGLKPPKEKKPKSFLRTATKILNTGSATTAGAVRGFLRPGISTFEGAKEGYKRRKTFGFRNILAEDLGFSKGAAGVGGFIGDVVFDPITYLTFGLGAGAKVGAKTLTKGGTKLFQKSATQLAKAGAKGSRGRALELMARAGGKKGLPKEAADEFIKLGVKPSTLDAIQRGGTKLVDKGGIKLFGRSLVTSKAIAGSPLGKVSRRLGETEVIKTLSNTLGKTFIPDFAKNPKLVKILDRGGVKGSAAIEGIVQSNEKLFKGLTDDQMREFFDTAFAKKKDIFTTGKQFELETLAKLQKSFPELKINTPEKGRKVLSELEGLTQKEVEILRKQIDEKIIPFFKKRQEVIQKTKGITGDAGKALGKTPGSFTKIDELNDIMRDLKTKLKEARKVAPQKTKPKKNKTTIGGEVTEIEKTTLAAKLIASEEERLIDIVEGLSRQLENVKTKGVTKAGAKKLPFRQLSDSEFVALAERKIVQLQNDLTKKTRLIEDLLGSGKKAKALQKTERLTFNDPKLQRVSDALFEGDDAIVKRFAKAAGIPEDEAIKFYIPSKFRDRLELKDAIVGRRLSSPSLGFQKKFRGVEKEDLIRDPFEAFSRGQVDVVTARIKGDTARAVIRRLGYPMSKFTEKQAAEFGMKKFSRTGVGGKIEGWVPEGIEKELNKLFTAELKPIDELARVTGFDYMTGLFKGYVTSLFPGFHIRNVTSNQFQNMLKLGLDAVNPTNHIRAIKLLAGKNLDDVIITKTGDRLTLGQIRKMIEKETDFLQKGAFSNLEQFIEKGSAARVGRRKVTLNPLFREFVALEAGRKVGGAAEAEAKVLSIITSIIEGKKIDQAVKTAEEALFNYSKLTDFERSVMRRLIPFYTFARKNAELQIRTLATTPGRVANQLKFIKGVGGTVGEPLTEEDIKGLPDFMLESLGIKAGVNQYGQSQFVSGFGLPIEEFLRKFSGDGSVMTNLLRDTMSQMNPNIKFLAERATGQDFFRGRPITEVDNAQSLAGLIKLMPDGVAKEFKEMIDFQELPNRPIYADGKIVGRQTKYKANPFALHLMRSLPSGRLQTTAGFLTDENQAATLKALRFFTGVRGWSIDQETQRFFNELERKDELKKWLMRGGYVGEVSNVFESKTK